MPKGIPKNGVNAGWFKAGNKIKRECFWCSGEFEVTPCRKDAKYCSRKCYYEARKTGIYQKEHVELVCEYCGEEYEVVPSRVGRSKYCSRKCQTVAIAPEEHSEETKRKIGEANRGNSRPDLAEYARTHIRRGKDNPSWRGGKTPITRRVRGCAKYGRWIKSIMKRDNWTCEDCGKRGGDLHVHHIKHFATIWDENNVETLDDAFDCKELWDTDSGVTLCPDCHYDRH